MSQNRQILISLIKNKPFLVEINFSGTVHEHYQVSGSMMLSFVDIWIFGCQVIGFDAWYQTYKE